MRSRSSSCASIEPRRVMRMRSPWRTLMLPPCELMRPATKRSRPMLLELLEDGGAHRSRPRGRRAAPAPRLRQGRRLQAELLELGRPRPAVDVPAASDVVLAEHRRQVYDTTLRGTRGDGLLEQAPGQRVVGAREAGGEVEEPLRVPDALADAQQLLGLDRLAPHGGEQAGVVVLLHGEGGELAERERVEHGVEVLHVDQQAGLAEGGEAVDHLRHAEDLGTEHVGAQVAAAAVGGREGETLPGHAARVVGRAARGT